MRQRGLLFTLLVFVAFFASGAASLVAEVTWNRMLIVVVGNSLSAAAMIIVIFMGGLGLGSFFGGRFFADRRPSLIPYLLLEACIGLYVLLSPAIFDQLTALFSAMADATQARGALTLLRVVVSTLALLLPACLMGATFPAIISAATPADPTRRTARIGYLYSANTVGAAIGTFAAGYHLLFEFGVRVTLGVACWLYLTAAVCALLANGLRSSAEGAGPAPAAEAGPQHGGRTPGLSRFLYAATFGVGFASLAYEVMLTRMSILYLGNSVSIFALVLTAFLLGTGFSAIVGTWLFSRLRLSGHSGHALFGWSALIAAVFILATPYVLLTEWVVPSSDFKHLADGIPRNPLPILGILIIPTIFLGALLPLAIRMLQSGERSGATKGAASLYSVNTVGGLLGAGLVNHYLVPVIGVQGALLLLSLICVAVGLGQLIAVGRGTGRWALTAASLLALGLLLGFALPPTTGLYAAKIAASTRAERTEIKLVVEGKAATVTVLDQFDPVKGSYRDIYLNGVEEASTRYWHVQLFKLLGILPIVAHESETPKDVLVIAFGAGITAGSTLASPDVARLDVVDLNPDIEGIGELFTEVNGDVFHEPRFHFHNDDGRNFLVTTHGRYDLIIGDSTHPRAYDSWILYTQEFYEAAKRKLKPGGIFAQWVPVMSSMRGELFQIHLNTVLKVFPNATFWYVYGSDQAFFMATPEPFTVDAARLQARLDRLAPWFEADHYQVGSVEQIAGFFWMDPQAMRKMIGTETRVNRDDRHYFDKQSAVRPLPPRQQLPFFQAAFSPHLGGGDEELRQRILAEQRVAGHMARYGFFRSLPDLYSAWCSDPGNGTAAYYMGLRFAGELPDEADFCLELEVESLRTMLARDPDNPLSLNALADRLAAGGRLDEALPLSERASALAPENGMVLDTQGWILARLGRSAEALAMLERADAFLPEHPIVRYHIGAALVALGRRGEARTHLQWALSRGAQLPAAETAAARALLSGLE